MAFSTIGIGSLLASVFDKAARSRPHAFPNVESRGQTLLMVADFGGQHKGEHYDTYAFLVLDLERNCNWLERQQLFRRTVMPNARRMSFKAMNDNRRRQGFIPFLKLAADIKGWLVVFAVSKTGGSVFGRTESVDKGEDLLSGWKPSVRERLLRVIHLSAFLLSGLSSPGQSVLWIIDEDEIAANVRQLTQITKVFARISSNLINHDLRHLRCGTTRSDDGRLVLEDLAAVADLGAGALSEVATAMINQGLFPRRGVITALPTTLTLKSRVLATWFASDVGSLRRLCCFIDLNTTSPSMRATMLQWHATPGQLWTPAHFRAGSAH
jgi:hypothetical protein